MAKLLLKWLDEPTLKLIAERKNLSFCNGKVGLYERESHKSLLDLLKDSNIKNVGYLHRMETYGFENGKIFGVSDGDYIETLELEQMGEHFYVRAYCENSDYYLDLGNAAEKRLCLMLTNEFAKRNDYVSVSDVCMHENYNAVLKAAMLLEKNGVIKLIPTEKGVVYHLEEAFIKDMWHSLFVLFNNSFTLEKAKEVFETTEFGDMSNKELFDICINMVDARLHTSKIDKTALLKLLPEAVYFMPTEADKEKSIIDSLCQMHEIELRDGKAFDLQENEEMDPQMTPEALIDWFIESVTEKQFYAYDKGYSYLSELLKELLSMKKRMNNIPTLTEEEVQIVKTALHQYGNKCMLNEDGEKERERIWKIEEKF